jgi:L-ascorbate metabolism protein UlaG (beta-lactamase superfamily)
MQISWLGHACFQITTQNGKNGLVKIVIDPFDKKIGLRMPKIEAGILLISHNHYDHNNKNAIKGDYFLIDGPGEYEVKGVYIEGISAFHDEKEGQERGVVTIFRIESEGIKVCHFSDFGQKNLTTEQEEKIGEVDVLMIPVGGVYTIGPKTAWQIVQQIEPKIVIPMHYKLPGLNIEIKGVKEFLKEAGQEGVQPEKKLTIKRKDLEGKGMNVVLLEPRVRSL